MELHYYTLKRQATELSVFFKEARIEASYTQKKNELILQLHNRERDNAHLIMSTDPQYPFMLLKSAQRRSKLSKDIMKDLVGKKIQGISILPGDRIIILDLIPGHFRLLLQFFLKRTNFFIVDENYKIQEAFKQNKKFNGQIYSVPTTVTLELNKLSLHKFTTILGQHAGKTVFQVLKKQFFELNNLLLKEIEFRLTQDLAVPTKQLGMEQIQILYDIIQKLLDQCWHDHPRIYLRDNTPYIFALTELKQYQSLTVKTYDSINDALTSFIFTKQKTEGYDKSVSDIKSLIKSKLEQLQHLIQRLKSLPEEQEQRDYYQKIGELILAQMLNIPDASAKVSLIDLFDPKQPVISVTLDPDLTAQENAQQYFNKARRVAENRRRVRQNLKGLEKQKEEILKLQSILEKPLEWKSLMRVEKKLQEMHILQTDSEKLQEIYKPYKQYFYEQWEIWIGKSAKDNDDLTFKRAHKEDTWMHAQGVSGSHVIIRSKKSSSPIPQPVIFHAARLAAGNSRAKHSSYVPVIYTKVKYVRKPKGSAPGEVSAERIKSIFAEPLII